jgi:hypothetical protein
MDFHLLMDSAKAIPIMTLMPILKAILKLMGLMMEIRLKTQTDFLIAILMAIPMPMDLNSEIQISFPMVIRKQMGLDLGFQRVIRLMILTAIRKLTVIMTEIQMDFQKTKHHHPVNKTYQNVINECQYHLIDVLLLS